MKVLMKINFNSSGTVLQDTAIWKSCNGHINKDTPPLGIWIMSGGVILVQTHAPKQVRTTSCFAVVETKWVPLLG